LDWIGYIYWEGRSGGVGDELEERKRGGKGIARCM